MIEIASHSEGILQKDISVNQSISTKYLDQIIASLKASGLVKRVSGKRSGYILARTPEEISVYDIYKAFEHELNVGDCPTKTSECILIGQCEIQNYWCDLNTTIENHMRSKTLDHILKDN
ncbi:MAG: Rrf2 family transcriptional regulator [Bacteroidales bacterium]|nr:Rrf2 family transcriptional regulator [Bacteroidota bacterium]MBL6949173.1 Rrf2 family transcriptional regulator [Bacteroidales bacterium]